MWTFGLARPAIGAFPLAAPPRSSATKVGAVSDRSRKLAKPAAALGLLATMVSIWWFALRPRRKIKLDE